MLLQDANSEESIYQGEKEEKSFQGEELSLEGETDELNRESFDFDEHDTGL